MNDEPQQYWFNTNTGEVEVGKQSAAIYRIGPFSSREEAARALQVTAERTKAWQSDEEAEG
jgi:hypothetical protein